LVRFGNTQLSNCFHKLILPNMWPITMDKKYGNINIYEIYFHILKKETFDFGMLNVTVSLC